MFTEQPGPPPIVGLDLGVAERQAFGQKASYSRPDNVQELLEAYWKGNFLLPPHPTWKGDPTDWTADPFTDKNWQFQQHTLRWLNPLRWAAVDGDNRARAEWVRVVQSWSEANVPAEKSRSPYAWKDMADGNRAIQLSLGASFVEEDSGWFIDLLKYHRDWLKDEKNIVGKNHGLHQHCGLLVVGSLLQDSSAVQLAISRMTEQFTSTFDDQGANDEGSAAYHHLNMIWWKQAWDRVRAEGYLPPADVTTRLELAAHALAHIAMPNGQIPQIGDSARGRISLGHSDFSDFVATSGKEGRAPDSKTLILDRGYILSRSGWGETRPLAAESHLLVRYGEELRAHSHRDRGSIHAYADGQRWLVDSGFHSYRAVAPVNRYLKSRSAHNVADVLNAKYNLQASVDLVHSEVNQDFHHFILFDNGYHEHSMTRRILYLCEADCWIISDQTATKGTNEISQRWHIEPDVTVSKVDRGFLLSRKNKRFSMTWLGPGGTSLRHIRASDEGFKAWIGTKWRTLAPSNLVLAQSTKSRPHIVALLAPLRKSHLGLVHSRITPRGEMEITLMRGSAVWKVHVKDTKVRVSQLG